MCLLLLPHPGCLPSLEGCIFNHLCAHTFLHKTNSIWELNHCNIEKHEVSGVLNLPLHLFSFICSAHIWLALSPIPQFPISLPQLKDKQHFHSSQEQIFAITLSLKPHSPVQKMPSLSEGKTTTGFLPRLKLEYLSLKQTSAALACGCVILRLECCYG